MVERTVATSVLLLLCCCCVVPVEGKWRWWGHDGVGVDAGDALHSEANDVDGDCDTGYSPGDSDNDGNDVDNNYSYRAVKCKDVLVIWWQGNDSNDGDSDSGVHAAPAGGGNGADNLLFSIG